MAARPSNDGRSLKCFISALHFSQMREGLVDLSGDTIAGHFCQTSGNRKMPCSNHHPVVKIDHPDQFPAGSSARRIKHPRLTGAGHRAVRTSKYQKNGPGLGGTS
jgi:hypothetical protein